MKRVIFSAAATVTGLVALLHFKTQPATPAVGSTAAGPSPTTTAATSDATASTTSRSASTSTATFTGDAADTRYGPVQVKVTVTNGKVTSVQAVEYPTDRARDVQINS